MSCLRSSFLSFQERRWRSCGGAQVSYADKIHLCAPAIRRRHIRWGIAENLRLFLEYDVRSGGDDVRNLMKNGKTCIINSNLCIGSKLENV